MKWKWVEAEREGKERWRKLAKRERKDEGRKRCRREEEGRTRGGREVNVTEVRGDAEILNYVPV